jgi:hypothetical protein
MTLKKLPVVLALALSASTLHAGEIDLRYQPEKSRWADGVRVIRSTDEFALNGEALTKTNTTKAGPALTYLFSPESRRSWYLGASLMQWKQTEKSLRTGTSDSASSTAPFFGGGYRGKVGNSFYYELGLLLSPAKLITRTADSSQESTGADVRVQFGIVL